MTKKTLTPNIHEAITVIDTVKKTSRVPQTGSLRRSMSQFHIACGLV